MSEKCDVCGTNYDYIYWLPDDVWREIRPIKRGFGGLLCIECAHSRAIQSGHTIRFSGSAKWWGDEKSKNYKTRTTQIMVHPANDSTTLSEMATTVSIVDEGSGEYVKAEQVSTGAILINPDEWPAIREAIDRMVSECRSET